MTSAACILLLQREGEGEREEGRENGIYYTKTKKNGKIKVYKSK